MNFSSNTLDSRCRQTQGRDLVSHDSDKSMSGRKQNFIALIEIVLAFSIVMTCYAGELE